MAVHPEANRNEDPRARVLRRRWMLGLVAAGMAIGSFLAAALIVSVFRHKVEARNPYVRFVEVTEDTTDPATWGVNWPRQYEGYMRTLDDGRTRYGGSDAIPRQKLDSDPWLRTMWAGHAFSLDYREARGHGHMLIDQEETERVLQKPQPGACLHCHSSVLPAYRQLGDGDIFEGFRKLSAMPWSEARRVADAHGQELIKHPANCVDCHAPETMRLRATRPAFLTAISEFMKHERGVDDYDVNRDATRQEMRTFACAQCHVEYYFAPETKMVTYPWSKGIKVEEMEAYYDEIGFSDWTHGITGGGMLKAQHPEFEIWSQGTHARAGVSCADCHMPYRREGAMKVSDHHVRSPLLNAARACQVCHNVPEDELLGRVRTIQDRTRSLLDRSSGALVDMIESIAAARESGADDDALADAIALQRKAQFRIDLVFSENSMGFHAPQETARLLAEAIDYARRGEVLARTVAPTLERRPLPEPPVEGATPPEHAPPGPYDHPIRRRD